MRSKAAAVMMVVLCMILFAGSGYGAQEETKATAFFPETSYEFPAVLDGAKVTHEFVIQNKGTETLTVEKVKTG